MKRLCELVQHRRARLVTCAAGLVQLGKLSSFTHHIETYSLSMHWDVAQHDMLLAVVTSKQVCQIKQGLILIYKAKKNRGLSNMHSSFLLLLHTRMCGLQIRSRLKSIRNKRNVGLHLGKETGCGATVIAKFFQVVCLLAKMLMRTQSYPQQNCYWCYRVYGIGLNGSTDLCPPRWIREVTAATRHLPCLSRQLATSTIAPQQSP